MKKILGGRASGKTCRLIKHAARNNTVIVCPTQRAADYVYMQASNMSVLIPKPVSLAKFMRDGSSIANEIMLDEADTILEMLLKRRFVAATFRDNDDERMWRIARPMPAGLIARCACHNHNRR